MFGLFESKKTVFQSGFLRGASDSHSHILYGVDDGIKTAAESLKTLALLEEAGVETLWLTPHIMEDVPNTTDGLMGRFDSLRELYKGSIELHLAAEYMMDTLYVERLRRRDLLLHGANRVLVEASVSAAPFKLRDILNETFDMGYIPILAHPERYLYLSPDDYRELRSMGVLMQMNMFSLTGLYGEPVRERALYLLGEGVYSIWGSDCHRLAVLKRQFGEPRIKKSVWDKVEALRFGFDKKEALS